MLLRSVGTFARAPPPNDIAGISVILEELLFGPRLGLLSVACLLRFEDGLNDNIPASPYP